MGYCLLFKQTVHLNGRGKPWQCTHRNCRICNGFTRYAPREAAETTR